MVDKINKYEELKGAIEKVHYQHTVDAGMMGLLSDQEALKAYKEIMGTINQTTELTEEEIKELTNIISDKIDRIIHPRHPMYNEDLITNEEEFKVAIENIHYRQRYDDGIMGTLNDGDAIKLYNILLGVLEKMKGLSPEVERALRKSVMVKIGQAPKVEREKIDEYNEYKVKQQVAFEAAKERFKSLSLFEKFKLYRLKQTPKHQDVDFMSVEEIDNLYIGRGR